VSKLEINVRLGYLTDAADTIENLSVKLQLMADNYRAIVSGLDLQIRAQDEFEAAFGAIKSKLDQLGLALNRHHSFLLETYGAYAEAEKMIGGILSAESAITYTDYETDTQTYDYSQLQAALSAIDVLNQKGYAVPNVEYTRLFRMGGVHKTESGSYEFRIPE
jgi:hypothetical protein